jgi:hypothetical protein
MATPPPPPDHPATGDDQSRSPSRRRPSPSPVHHHGRHGCHDQCAAPARIVREVSVWFPLLTKTNYADWSAMMKVDDWWAAVKEGTAAMEALLCGVPLEIAASLVSKPSTKVTWDQLESSCLGSDHVHMSSAQRVRRQYENIVFQDGEFLNDRVHELEILGDPEETRKVAVKYLRVVPEVCPRCCLN